MGRCRFVDPVVVRVDLTDGDWIDVKRDLTTGEQRAMFAQMRSRDRPGAIATIDPSLVTTARLMAYVVGWSFRDRDDRPVPVSVGALDSLDTRTFGELRDALDAHEAARDRALDDEKKSLTTSIASDPISRSAA
jgi:hypothetical protein